MDIFHNTPEAAKETVIVCVQDEARALPCSVHTENLEANLINEDNVDYERKQLEEIGRNIDAVERTMVYEKSSYLNMDIDYGGVEDSKIKRFKMAGKQFLSRSFSLGSSEKDYPLKVERKPGTSALMKIKNLIRFKRRHNRCYDEERALVDPAGPYASQESDDEIPMSPNSSSSDELPIEVVCVPNVTPKNQQMPVHFSGTGIKPADFQVCITVIEARQLVGTNMDPVVCVQIGEKRKYTSVKESTNCPYYNEYFVFDFHIPPIMLFDKIITLSVLQSRPILYSNKLLGSFKLDVATVWSQPDRQFYHKWAVLTDPDDINTGVKGFLKCDISVNGKGDPVKIPLKCNKDDNDIEANLLRPYGGITLERQRARFIIKVYRADGLPKMNYSIVANVKRAFTGEIADLVDPYVQVAFAGKTGKVSVKKNCYTPVWNEQVIFTEMFPPLCQRIKIQLRDADPVHPSTIGTHYIDLKEISNDGEKGFLPTFGPTFLHIYGSTRDYSLLDQHSGLNTGMGEGVSYRGRVLVSIGTEILENNEESQSDVHLEQFVPIDESLYEKHQTFFLFGSIYDADMIDKGLVEKPLYFELSIGNCGNSLDGNNESVKRPTDLEIADLDTLKADVGYWNSTTSEQKALSKDKCYYYLPYWENKQGLEVRSIWPDQRPRMFNSNQISNIIQKFEEGMADVQAAMDVDVNQEGNAISILKKTLEKISAECANYSRKVANNLPLGATKLDKDRRKMCRNEIENISNKTRTLKALVTKYSLNIRIKTAYSYLNRLKQLCEDPQQSMPDVFIWLISNGKRLAYQRIPAREILYSSDSDEIGKYCGKMRTLFLKWPGKKSTTSRGWAIPAKINVFLWLGMLSDKKHVLDSLPEGYEITNEIRNLERPLYSAPRSMYYLKKHNFQLRAYLYQARSLIASDSSGLSDPFAKVIIGEFSASTQVIDETLSPTWDEVLVIDNVLLYGTMNHIKENPPVIIIEIFDQDDVGKSEFIGRTLARPHIKNFEEPYVVPLFPPPLKWYEIRRGDDHAGELLATFELLELPPKEKSSVLPQLPSPKKLTADSTDTSVGTILPVPRGIRPTLSKYRIEVLFWGLRDLKKIHFLTIDKPRVDIECAGHVVSSTIIQNIKENPNFLNPVRFIDLELPDQDLYRPPLTIRVIDCRSFGRNMLVGTHTINSIQKYMYTPKTKKEKEAEARNNVMDSFENIEMVKKPDRQHDHIFIECERENAPLLASDVRNGILYGTSTGARKKEIPTKRKKNTATIQDEDEVTIDWWTKYFASVKAVLEKERDEKLGANPRLTEDYRSREEITTTKKNKKSKGQSGKNKVDDNVVNKNTVSQNYLMKIYPHELEADAEHEEFKEWLQSFDLYRGKKTGDAEDDHRVVGSFKGAIKAYKWPLPKGSNDHSIMGFDPRHGFFQGLPNNDPVRVLLRVYIIRGTDLHPMDINGKSDPYIVLQLGSKRIMSDKKNYLSKQLNPVFGKCFEIEAILPQDSLLTIQVYDWDLFGRDDLIGETKIDLENRFYTRHRATCGLPKKYEEHGFNKWRDSQKPTQILAKLCKEGKLDSPKYEYGRVKIGNIIFHMPMHDEGLFDFRHLMEEQMALIVLRRWHEMPRVGTKLVEEHIETRPIYNASKPGLERGRLEMWVDLFPMDKPLPGPPIDITPRTPQSYELRVIVWNTDDVVLEDDAFFTGEKMSDIYVRGWIKGPEDTQGTDIHYRSLTGEGNFNWRFIFPFDYLEAEERIVITRKVSIFSWDETQIKIPARVNLQVWDADHFSSDDFLGAMNLDLNRFPRAAKSSKLCTLNMLKNDGSVPMVNLFKQRRVKGWWPFYTKKEDEPLKLTGKLEAELHLLTKEEAAKIPAGLGRNEPDPLEKPSRPDASFMWFLNPLKSIRYILWHNYKWKILKGLLILAVMLLILLFIYAFPGYLAKMFLGA